MNPETPQPVASANASNGASGSIDFTAVVVVYNEADRLAQALDTIRFCREFIVVDLGSTDASLDIARRYDARILTHERPPYPNLPRQHGIRHASHGWIVTIDPDEDFPTHELPKIEALIRSTPDLAGVRLPWQFYFRGRPLTTTHWGNPNNKKMTIVHRDRIRTTPYVHQEYELGAGVHTFKRGQIDPVKHYWMRSWAECLDKHRRYAGREGEKRYHAGRRFTWPGMAAGLAEAAWRDLVKFRAVTSPTGLMLTGFHQWYEAKSWLNLRQFQRTQRPGDGA